MVASGVVAGDRNGAAMTEEHFGTPGDSEDRALPHGQWLKFYGAWCMADSDHAIVLAILRSAEWLRRR